MNSKTGLFLALLVLVSFATSIHGQCYTYCVVSDVIVGCCPQTHPWCCIVSGVIKCCRYSNDQNQNTTSLFLRRQQMKDTLEIDYIDRLNAPAEKQN